jgi:hypothetical protein
MAAQAVQGACWNCNGGSCKTKSVGTNVCSGIRAREIAGKESCTDIPAAAALRKPSAIGLRDNCTTSSNWALVRLRPCSLLCGNVRGTSSGCCVQLVNSACEIRAYTCLLANVHMRIRERDFAHADLLTRPLNTMYVFSLNNSASTCNGLMYPLGYRNISAFRTPLSFMSLLI